MKLISKNNVSVVVTLILVVMLSQSYILDFLLETYLGRIILLACVLFVSANNKNLGLVIVLALIVFFNYKTVIREGNRNRLMLRPKAKKRGPKPKKGGPKAKKAADGVSLKKVAKVDNEDEEEKGVTQTGATEGFCMSDRETSILRGKRPNSVPILNHLRNQSNEVDPHDTTDFEASPSTF